MTRQSTSGHHGHRRCGAILALLGVGAACGLLTAAPLAATSVVLGSDAELADQAPVILEATVLGLAPELPAGAPRRAPTTDYQLRVERVLKGSVAGEMVRLRVLGGRGPDGLTVEVWGTPSLRAGERVLLFLVADADGSVRPLHLAVGVFHAVEPAAPGGNLLAVRDLSEMELVDARGGAALPGTVQVRDYARFARWLADRAAGRVRPPDYQLQLLAGDLRRLSEKFTYIGGHQHRWFEFDRGIPIHWTMSQAGQPGVDDGGFGEFQTAINAWNTNPGTNIKYRFDGTSNYNGGLSHPDGHNELATEDPQDDLPGSFSCVAPGVGSGILAAARIVYYSGVPEPIPIIEADIVTQDGVGCWFNHDPARAAQVFAHELGHTLGLGHSCGDSASGPCDTGLKDDALMRTTAHNDDRGAAIHEDDRAGIATLYGGAGGGGGGGSPPAAPSGLTATALSASSIALTWQDNSNDATHVDVESRGPGAGYQQIQVLPGGATTVTVAGLAAGTSYSFRVRAQNGAGFSDYSNSANAATLAAVPPPPPTSLTATAVATPSGTGGGAAGGQVALAWQLSSQDTTAVKVDASSPLGDFARLASLPGGATSYLVTGLIPGMPYTFRVRAQSSGGLSAPSNLASATAATGGPPAPCGVAAPAGASLCLLGGRFQITVDWRNTGTGEHSTGRAIALADHTGMFWFFSSTNVELIVKLIDGRPLNGSFWTFYGGLSDVEYWITVTDTVTGHAQTYLNPAGDICGGADTRSFSADKAGTPPAPAAAAAGASAPPVVAPLRAPAPAAAGPCGGDARQLCLLGGRFQVEVSWTNTASGASGTGTAVPLNDQSGLFWFFDAGSIELVVKVVDGRALNGKFWLFYGALSDVQYDLRVTDLGTGEVRTYHNTAGNLCGRGDTSAF
jgi:Fibronectin type III domain/Matrixin